jgi:hypothetical protein
MTWDGMDMDHGMDTSKASVSRESRIEIQATRGLVVWDIWAPWALRGNLDTEDGDLQGGKTSLKQAIHN